MWSAVSSLKGLTSWGDVQDSTVERPDFVTLVLAELDSLGSSKLAIASILRERYNAGFLQSRLDLTASADWIPSSLPREDRSDGNRTVRVQIDGVAFQPADRSNVGGLGPLGRLTNIAALILQLKLPATNALSTVGTIVVVRIANHSAMRLDRRTDQGEEPFAGVAIVLGLALGREQRNKPSVVLVDRSTCKRVATDGARLYSELHKEAEARVKLS